MTQSIGFRQSANFKKRSKTVNINRKKLGDFITDIRYGLSTANDYVDFGIPFLRILNLKNDGIDVGDVVYLSEEQRKEVGKAIVHEGDLLISRSGSVGIVVVVPKEAEGFAFGSFYD